MNTTKTTRADRERMAMELVAVYDRDLARDVEAGIAVHAKAVRLLAVRLNEMGGAEAKRLAGMAHEAEHLLSRLAKQTGRLLVEKLGKVTAAVGELERLAGEVSPPAGVRSRPRKAEKPAARALDPGPKRYPSIWPEANPFPGKGFGRKD